VITPSHNPPEDGGFKYNPPTGGPADAAITRWIQDRANELLASAAERVPRIPYPRARSAPTTHPHDYVGAYVADLASVVDMEAVRAAGLRLGVDPLGGASLLARDRGALRGPDRGGQPRSGRRLQLHAARLGRPDPHGFSSRHAMARLIAPAQTASTSPSATIRTATATASSRPRD
jgi:hypothetical protein